ncbi:hypothetical protein BDV11DRAFT_191241 [Aspergillus similis]
MPCRNSDLKSLSEDLIWNSQSRKRVLLPGSGLDNGIRFSVSDLSPPLSRILPTLYAYRLGISLYDCQFDSQSGDQPPIPDHIIVSVLLPLSDSKYCVPT